MDVAARSAAQKQANAELEEELRATADLLTAVSVPEGLDVGERRALFEAVQLRRYAPVGKAAYELRTEEGEILRSAPFPEFSVAPPPGMATVRGTGDTWQVLTVVDLETGAIRRAALPDTSQDQRANDLRAELVAPWAIALPLFAIAVLGSVWIGLRPLRRIELRMTSISPYDPEPLGLDCVSMPREIGTLAQSFDRLAERLARIMSDQRIFASAASHELRTPLAGALSQLEVLRRAPERRTSIDRLGEALAHMERLVTQLLFLVRSNTVAASDRPERVDLVALTWEVGEELGLRETLQIEGKGGMTGYRDLLKSLLRNLLLNAQTASNGEKITVGIGERADAAMISVLDLGPGIPGPERQRLIEPFQRGAGKPGTGAGLGLTVAQRIAELHGGWIEIADRPGGGAAVTAILPGPWQGSAGVERGRVQSSH